jgi:uncharacterized protein
MSRSRVLVWEAVGRYGSEFAHVRFGAAGELSADGTQIGVGDHAYRLDYELETDEQLVTKRLQARVEGLGWTRAIDLRRTPGGRWECDSSATGEPGLPAPGGPMEAVDGALDCDLGFSPLTNLMPVRREGLLEQGSRDFTMAWVSVPSLEVLPSQQTYEFVRRDEHGSTVRYVGRHRGFEGELRFDREAFVCIYPGLAVRRHPPLPAAA